MDFFYINRNLNESYCSLMDYVVQTCASNQLHTTIFNFVIVDVLTIMPTPRLGYARNVIVLFGRLKRHLSHKVL